MASTEKRVELMHLCRRQLRVQLHTWVERGAGSDHMVCERLPARELNSGIGGTITTTEPQRHIAYCLASTLGIELNTLPTDSTVSLSTLLL